MLADVVARGVRERGPRLRPRPDATPATGDDAALDGAAEATSCAADDDALAGAGVELVVVAGAAREVVAVAFGALDESAVVPRGSAGSRVRRNTTTATATSNTTPGSARRT